MTNKQHKYLLKVMAENFPKYILENSLLQMKELLKNIKKSRKTNPNVYLPNAEINVKKRIVDLKKVINSL